jgi:hypothetical protein
MFCDVLVVELEFAVVDGVAVATPAAPAHPVE